MPDYDTLMWNEVADIGDLIDSIDDGAFEQPSLCEGWKVRDVIGHMAYGHTTGAFAILGGVVRYRGNMTKGSFELSKEFAGSRSPAELRRLWRTELVEKRTVRGISRVIKKPEAFLDHFVHNQDIRRPLALARDIPEERLLAALPLLPAIQTPLFGTKKVVQGLQWRATDVEWSHGDGAPVEGPAEALVLAAAGRQAALADLRGEGVAALRSRLAG